ncbi:MAG: toll/interleukin-1 receptor domain-containing protein, partial [Rhodanobacter sp.]
MPQLKPASDFHYRAFISYSHQDKVWADWLHKALETYRVPSRLVGTETAAGVIPKRLAPIFRDRDELASAFDLGNKVNEALAQSANLIVICSPHSAGSRWVNEEVLAYKRLGRSERIFCLIVDGEPNASDLTGRAAEECFAPALRLQFDADGPLTSEPAEPIAADARPGKDGKGNAKLKLIAGMLGVGFDALKQRELQRRTRKMTAITALALAVMAVTSVLAVYALISRHEAVIARHHAVVAQQAAERRQKQAEGLVGFMLGNLNDKLSQINRLDIIESVDDKAMDYFKSLPTTDVTDKAIVQRARALERIGSVRLDQGHLPAALDSYQASLILISAQARKSPQDMPLQLAWAEVESWIGMTCWFQGNLDQAERNFRTAQQILERVENAGADNPKFMLQMQNVESNLGHVLESRGKLDEAKNSYQKALDLDRKLVATDRNNVEWNVLLGSNHNNLGKLALTRGDLVTA